jgi:glutathione synthase/RimK-type ligase-like ATP-grasp enzyme
MAKQPVLGILTLYLNDDKSLEERKIYERMTAAGRGMGLSVVVFTPEDVEETSGLVHAQVFRPDKKRWARVRMRIPRLVYDRARYQKNSRFKELLAFRRKHAHLLYLNRPLRNKWIIYRTLRSVPSFRPFLPATRLYQSPDDVSLMLKKFPTVYFKPINGTGGRGILRIDRQRSGMLLLQGRNHARDIVPARSIRRETLAPAIRSWDLHGDKYIVQQGLDIKLPDGRVHDYRMLVQKNGSGEWQATGCAGRVGRRNSITSNLHGGGTAASMEELLGERNEDADRIGSIRQTVETFSLAVAKHLEQTYGALCELALDLAIDRKGDIWLLEVNPKPAREVFLQAGEREIYRRAVTLPLEYSMWLYRQEQIGSVASTE